MTNLGSRLERLEESSLLSVLFYVTAVAGVLVTGLDTGFTLRPLTVYEFVAVIILAVPAGFLFVVSVTDLIFYFAFIPSISHDGHLFARVHGAHLVHPLTTSIVLGLAVMCLLTGSFSGSLIWGASLAVYVLQTALMVTRVRHEHLLNGLDLPGNSLIFLLLHLIVGTEIITLAGGAKPLPPWRLNTLPEDTWIVDVRTKPEFHWNRLQGAENFPWGMGVAEAARDKSRDRPVLVMCFSGHRSPPVAVMLRKLGFSTVYNLNWGILYLVLLERGRKGEGPFSLTRPHRDPYRRGEDVRGITVGYVTLQALILVIAPLDNGLRQLTVSAVQQAAGVTIGALGLAAALASYRALGRNFRVFAAPRRSGTLITTGIYSWVRHPMYTGVVTMFAGYILLWGSLLSVPLWLAFTLLYMIKSVKEESILAERFPEYVDYRKRTWKFLPFIY